MMKRWDGGINWLDDLVELFGKIFWLDDLVK